MPGCAVAELDAQSDSGGASRFFYCAKASRSDKGAATNTHPTPKSTKLMQYLITLITPSGGTVLDPFMGSGSTGVAAKRLGFHFIGIEKEADYFKIAKERIDSA
jgi:site-specific DNA-methyltransferase (adenine-specific)